MNLAARLPVTRKQALALTGLLVVAIALRLWGIERYGLWIDEVAAMACLKFDLTTILSCSWVKNQSLLPHVVNNLFYTALGRPPLPIAEWLARLPEVMAGTATILAAWFATRALMGVRAAWLTALLWTLAPTAVAYSQDARPYPWLALFSNLSTLALVHVVRKPSYRIWILYGILCTLNFYNHYLGAFVIAGQVLFALLSLAPEIRRDRKSLRRVAPMVCGLLVFVLSIAPWARVIRGQLISFGTTKYVKLPLNPQTLGDAQVWLVLNQTAQPLAAIALLALEIAGAVWLWKSARTALWLMACWIGFTVGFLLVRNGDFTAFRYWLVIQPPIYWLLAAGGLGVADGVVAILNTRGVQFNPRLATAMVAASGVIALAPGLSQFYVDPFESWRFDDWRGAATFLRAATQPDDLILAFGDASAYHILGLQYYIPQMEQRHLVEPDGWSSQLTEWANTHVGRVWGIVYTRAPEQQAALRAVTTREVDFKSFRNLTVVSLRPSAPNETVAENARRLLQLIRPLDSRWEMTDALLNDVPLAKNLLANPDLRARKGNKPRGWRLGGEDATIVALDGEPALQLARAAGDMTSVQQQIVLKPEQSYVMRFECRTALTSGTAWVYVTFSTSDGRLIVFPKGSGVACPDGKGWHRGGFAFRVPALAIAAPRATILLRNEGIGDAYWRHLSLSPIAAP